MSGLPSLHLGVWCFLFIHVKCPIYYIDILADCYFVDSDFVT